MRTMVDFTNEKLVILAKESTPRGRNALKEIERRKAAGIFRDPAEVAPKAAVEKPKTRRRKKTIQSEVTLKEPESDSDE